MPTWNYEGHRANGRPIKGSIEAANQEDANQMLRESGIFAREVTQGELKLIFNHPPDPRPKAPEAAPEAPKASPEVAEPENPEPADNYDQWRNILSKNLLAVEAARKELKKYGEMIKGGGKNKKAQESNRKEKVERFEKGIDDACNMALAMAIHDSVKMLKDI